MIPGSLSNLLGIYRDQLAKSVTSMLASEILQKLRQTVDAEVSLWSAVGAD